MEEHVSANGGVDFDQYFRTYYIDLFHNKCLLVALLQVPLKKVLSKK